MERNHYQKMTTPHIHSKSRKRNETITPESKNGLGKIKTHSRNNKLYNKPSYHTGSDKVRLLSMRINKRATNEQQTNNKRATTTKEYQEG